MQKMFVDCLLKGQPQTIAARSAGYRNPGVEGHKLVRMPKIQEAMRYLEQKHEKAAQMSRKKVMDGFLEAIEMAKVQGEAATMVNGWREIGRMCGYYAAETKKLDINITAKRAVDQLETLSDGELLEMIERDSDVIEGEFSEIFDTAQDVPDGEDAG